MERQPAKRVVYTNILIFMTCSSSMLVLNKVAITVLPLPATLLLLQMSGTVVAIYFMDIIGWIDSGRYLWSKAKSYIPVALAFLAALYTNIRTLEYVNIETFIVFRSSTPLSISVLDYIFLGRCLPNKRSTLALLGILSSASAYVAFDSQFEVRGYAWVIAWYCVFCFDQIFIKHVVDTTDVPVWGRSFYTNALSLPAVTLVALFCREFDTFREYRWEIDNSLVVLASCIAGILMSYSSFKLRGMISATSFTLVGNACKIISVILNYYIWDKHTSRLGLCFLVMCLCCAIGYEQSPLRSA